MNNFIITSILLLYIAAASAQPNIQWQKCLGGSNFDIASSVQQTSDGGYIVAGLTQSNNGDVSGNHGSVDLWVTKLNSNGEIQWQRALGGSNVDVGGKIIQTNDGGYILVGFVLSNNGDISGNHGEADFWVVKLNSSGAIQWQKTLGGSKGDEPQAIQQTLDGGFIVVGYTNSNDGDVSGNHGQYDFWVVKLSNVGAIEWQKTLGGTGSDEAYSVQQTTDGGYIVAGKTFSNDGDVSGNHGDIDYWVVKLNSIGAIEWQKAFGGSGADDGGLVCQTMDGGYVVAGGTGSNDGQVSGVYGKGDAWVVKLDQEGELQWQKTLGGTDQDGASSIFQTSNGSYVLSILTESMDGDVVGNDGGADVWVVKLSAIGDILWQKTYGGSQAEVPGDLNPTSDGGFVFCGYTSSNDGDVAGNHGTLDFWIVKLSPESSHTSTPASLPLEIYPNPATHTISIKTPNEEHEIKIKISDLLGQELRQQTFLNGGDLDITAFRNGLYLLTATTPTGKVYSGKITKQE
ncbi:MAG: T9SS type A sorting domain-containing protein [Saprospiraceae bacterium]